MFRQSLVFTAACEDDTDRLGQALAELLSPGQTVALIGTLGAGKTRFTQALAAGLNVPREQVVSPTFVLCQQYQGRLPIYHLDSYRLRDEDEYLELGPEEYYQSPGITIVEWADRVLNCLPPDYLRIEIEVTGETSRRFTISAVGEDRQLQRLRQRLRKRLEESE